MLHDDDNSDYDYDGDDLDYFKRMYLLGYFNYFCNRTQYFDL